MARITAFVVGAVSIAIAIVLGPTFNVAFLVGLAFAVAASANLPVILLSIFWRRFTTEGAVCGLATGLLSSLVLIVISPSIMGITAGHLIHAAPFFRWRTRESSAFRWDFSGRVFRHGVQRARSGSRTQVHGARSPRQHGTRGGVGAA